ncbi:hypothetical protein DFH09DRAFT_47246 [Mycena vulgaris]|nr:hypothetical protein DFH09DRAFT_47246 [Mycena vulgaris]
MAERRATHNAVERMRWKTLNGRFLVRFLSLASCFLFCTRARLPLSSFLSSRFLYTFSAFLTHSASPASLFRVPSHPSSPSIFMLPTTSFPLTPPPHCHSPLSATPRCSSCASLLRSPAFHFCISLPCSSAPFLPLPPHPLLHLFRAFPSPSYRPSPSPPPSVPRHIITHHTDPRVASMLPPARCAPPPEQGS